MIEKHVLSNGLRVVIERIPSVRSVAIGVWVGTGSRHESPATNGISHFIEHMLFKGTDKYSARDIAEAFDSIGGHVNAFTSKEYTCYYARVLDQHVTTATKMLAEIFFRSSILEEELVKERNVVIEEIRMYEDTPDDLVHDLISHATYGKRPLGYSILGTEQVLKTFTRDDLVQYIDSHYTIDNTVIAIAGNVTDDILPLLEELFGQFDRRGSNTTSKDEFESGVIVRKKATEQSHICIGMPGLAINDRRIYPLVLFNNLLGGSMSSRLFQEVREERGLAYSVYSYHTAYKDSGHFTIYAGTSPKQADEVIDVTLNLLNDLKAKGITDQELLKSKEQLKGSIMLSLESTNSRMSRIGKNELLLQRHLTLDEMIALIDAVKVEDIRDTIDYVLSKPFSFAMVSPSEELPSTFAQNKFSQ